MRTVAFRFAAIVAVVVCCTGYAFAQQTVRFNRDVRPILSRNCFECHGFDEKARQASLRLDTQDAATAELESGDGQAIVPGAPEQSELLARVLSDDSDHRMPPSDSGKVLSEKEIQTLRDWIAQGAPYEQHWSFVAPESVPLPPIKQTTWRRNWIDDFVLARLEQADLEPSAEADRRTLIRRVALDVTGLPPTREEIRVFLNDESVDAYERMVDRYLSSRNYGEHMARYWLDLARYADSNGYQYDTERKMWVWRDWVINAYNNNMPFDRFTMEQIAGDLLPGANPQQVLATAFNRNHPITIEGGVIDEEYRTEYVIDRLVTTSTVWMGLTVACARCHDHKFDPISQREFYELFAFFNQVPERGLNGFEPSEKIASPLAVEQQAQSVEEIASLKAKLAALEDSSADDALLAAWTSEIATSSAGGWEVLDPQRMASSGGSAFTKQADLSVVVGGANPSKDVYEIVATTDQAGLTAVRLECLTDASLPGGGPGRHVNSNFVLSEFEVDAISIQQPVNKQRIKFVKAVAEYSQANYEIGNAIDGSVAGNNGWAVDGPTRKEPVTALFVASEPFGYEGGTELVFRLRHEATFATHGVGRPRLSITRDKEPSLDGLSIPQSIRVIAAKKPETRGEEEVSQLRAFFRLEQSLKLKRIEAEIAALVDASAAAYPATMVMRELASPRPTHVLMLGQYDRPGEVVTAGVPSALLRLPDDVPANRLGLAQWLVDPQHPLTARVAVNRYWQRIFGTGLVKTSEDFGTQGEWPSHPELLDTLARQFIDSGWDVKAIQRLMLTSAVYRQSPRVTPALLERDPANRLLARGARFRLDAEQIRDQALAASGLLVAKIGGPSVYPYQPDGLWLELNNRPGLSTEYPLGKGDDLYRRSMYTFWKRTVVSPMLTTLDAPEREFCTVRRSRTNTPLQALLLLQGPQFVEAARQLAARMLTEGGPTAESRIAFAFELSTARIPSDEEIGVLVDIYRERLAHFSTDTSAAIKMLSVGDFPRDPRLDLAQHAAWTEVARLILNLDETTTRG